jgi:pyruvate dehydrogenase E1 component
MEARRLLATEWGVSVDAWSVTSYVALRRDALSVQRWNRLHPSDEPRAAYISQALAPSGDERGDVPVVAVSDYVHAVPDQISRWVHRPFASLGTDGFGRSDTRQALRRFFEIDAAHVTVAVLAELVRTGDAKPDEVAEAIARYGLDTDTADPWSI